MPSSEHKILIAFFSRTGNTKAAAEVISKETGGDLYEIIPEKPYDGSYLAAVARAKIENITGARPVITNLPDDISSYDTVFIGFPNWWGSVPNIMATFTEKYAWNGKTVIPFFTHGGGGLQRCDSSIRKLIPDAGFKKYLCLPGKKVKESQAEIISWLKSLDL